VPPVRDDSPQALTTTVRESESHPRLSVIVPAYNGGTALTECLDALRASVGPEHEVLLVDDASTDDTAARAEARGLRVIRLARNGGPAAARNEGARQARGDVLLFVDADVVLAPDAIGRVTRTLLADASVSAIFGSYDAHPRAPGTVSQYRNLLHHFVHQTGNVEASTFWAGCGAVRRAAFAEVGGFDELRYNAPAIEDIELGYRLRSAGHRIVLDKQLLATHLKRWTLRSMIRTDLWRRAIPWSRLIFERSEFPGDLNLKAAQRVSVTLTGLAAVFLVLAAWRPEFVLAAVVALAGVVVLNQGLFRFLARERGLAFAVACVPLHLVHHSCSGLGFVLARLELLWGGRLTAEPGLPAERSTPDGR
jgi:glycosyltransferase involved in cell wall biosynthesis